MNRLTIDGLLIELIERLGHTHSMMHRLERKVDYLIEVAGSGGDQSVVDAATKKLRASNDATEKAVAKTEDT